jgi:hypothetical protein
MRKLKHGLQIAVVGSMVAVAAAKLVLQYRSSTDPDPSSGRVQPVNLAPRMSDDWDYVTSTDMLVYGGLLSTVLLLFLAWGVISLIDRRRGPDGSEQPVDLEVSGTPVVAVPGATPAARQLRFFGRRGRRPNGQVDHPA